ncbi:MAG: RluA family pseudouridine synthase [Chlamydiales bacterium]|nr:RluA family pseudouridine synthase [Chlamydiales bacterium]
MKLKQLDIQTIVADPSICGLRLDQALSSIFQQHSRTYFQYLIEQQAVKVNGTVLKKREKIKVNDTISVNFLAMPEISLKAQEIPLDIIYEDEHILVINKPQGMVVHPAPGHVDNTFVNALLHHCQTLDFQENELRPGIVHRLDKDTSGIMMSAKTTKAHQELVKSFAKREVKKTYLAICIGKPIEGIIHAPIGRHPIKRKEMSIQPDGKEAITDIKIIRSNGQLSLIEAKPVTGRTHQIRVHLKHTGHPILGDTTYGLDKWNQKHQFFQQLLHSYQIIFPHPITKKNLTLSSSLPNWYNLVD